MRGIKRQHFSERFFVLIVNMVKCNTLGMVKHSEVIGASKFIVFFFF